MSSQCTPVMQGDVVRSSVRDDGRLGWVCCITPETNEGHVYWQPVHGTDPPAETREQLRTIECTDRALIPGDIVRRGDVTEGEDQGGRDRDGMGMIVGTEVILDLAMVNFEGRPCHTNIAAGSLRHLLPVRLAAWVVHRGDGWLGRVISWDEDLVVSCPGTDGQTCRFRIRAANSSPSISGIEGFYRDFFPCLRANVNLQDLKSGALSCEWLAGDVSQLLPASTASASTSVPARIEVLVEQVTTAAVRVEWVAQVPMKRGWCSHGAPSGCSEQELLFLLSEAECSSRWVLGDRLLYEGHLAEVCGVRTFVDVRWQDDALSVRIPASSLQLCNPDAFSFFPSELVSLRGVEEVVEGQCHTGADDVEEPDSSPSGGQCAVGSATRSTSPSKIGYVVRADASSRMVVLRWLQDDVSKEEEWSAFDLHISPEFGFRLGDVVIRKDWEASQEAAALAAQAAMDAGNPLVGQVVALSPARCASAGLTPQYRCSILVSSIGSAMRRIQVQRLLQSQSCAATCLLRMRLVPARRMTWS